MSLYINHIVYLGGVTCYDACTKEQFQLHAHIIAWTGDIPALTKVMNITGHNSYSGCRFCDIQGVYSQKYKHIYFPDGNECIKKNNSDWLLRVSEIEATETNSEKDKLIRQYGKYLLVCIGLLL